MSETRNVAARGSWRGAAGGEEESGNGRYRTRLQSSITGHKEQGPAHGCVKGDVWLKTARASLHQLRSPRAWAVDAGDLDAAEGCGARYVVLRDLDGLREHWAALSTLRLKGFRLNRGFGEQLALLIEHWQPDRERAEAAAPPEPAGRQLSLWGARP